MLGEESLSKLSGAARRRVAPVSVPQFALSHRSLRRRTFILVYSFASFACVPSQWFFAMTPRHLAPAVFSFPSGLSDDGLAAQVENACWARREKMLAACAYALDTLSRPEMFIQQCSLWICQGSTLL